MKNTLYNVVMFGHAPFFYNDETLVVRVPARNILDAIRKVNKKFPKYHSVEVALELFETKGKMRIVEKNH